MPEALKARAGSRSGPLAVNTSTYQETLVSAAQRYMVYLVPESDHSVIW